MSLFADALAWLTEPGNWSGASGIPVRVGEHLFITFVTLVAAGIIAIPAGVLIGHTGRGAGFVGAVTGAARAIPTLGILTIFGLALGIGLEAPLLALIILAIPSLLAGSYAGLQSIDRATIDAARAIGMSTPQLLRGVELPLALPVMLGGIRAAALQVIATATLAAYTTDSGLGRFLFSGLKTRDYAQMLGGAIVVIFLALVLELTLAAFQRAARARTTDRVHQA